MFSTTRRVAIQVTIEEHDDDMRPGARVKVVRDPEWNGPWPSEPTGIIDPDAEFPMRTVDLAATPEIHVPDSERGVMREFLVRFDQPQRDGDGAGPYESAVIWEKYLRLVG
jgi:hypothetical protein